MVSFICFLNFLNSDSNKKVIDNVIKNPNIRLIFYIRQKLPSDFRCFVCFPTSLVSGIMLILIGRISIFREATLAFSFIFPFVLNFSEYLVFSLIVQRIEPYHFNLNYQNNKNNNIAKIFITNIHLPYSLIVRVPITY